MNFVEKLKKQIMTDCHSKCVYRFLEWLYLKLTEDVNNTLRYPQKNT